MTIHIYFKDNTSANFDVTRITMFLPGSEPGWLDPKLVPALVMGTRPDIMVIPIAKINWYWIEED